MAEGLKGRPPGLTTFRELTALAKLPVFTELAAFTHKGLSPEMKGVRASGSLLRKNLLYSTGAGRVLGTRR
jgi:hypothetical protein